jgi:hypothetical protein
MWDCSKSTVKLLLQYRFTAAAAAVASLQIRVARFLFVKCTKTGKTYQMTLCIPYSKNMYILNHHELYQMAEKNANIYRSKGLPNHNFWYENICNIWQPWVEMAFVYFPRPGWSRRFTATFFSVISWTLCWYNNFMKSSSSQQCIFFGRRRRRDERVQERRAQGCQIFIGTTYQNGKNMYQMTTKCTNWP